jgi:hypothetical protein
MFDGLKEQIRLYLKAKRDKKAYDTYVKMIKEHYGLDIGDVVEFEDGKEYLYVKPAVHALGNPGFLEPEFTTPTPEVPHKVFYIRDCKTVDRFSEEVFGGGRTIKVSGDGEKVEQVVGFINSPWMTSRKTGRNISPEEWKKMVAELESSMAAE